MIRLFVSEKLEVQKSFEATEKQQHYLRHVMRLNDNESILLFNGKDGEWLCRVEICGKKKMLFYPQQKLRTQETETSCILCPALIKRENMELVLQKATELGVTEIFPVITERTVVRHLNLERARLIVTEAAEQCERLSVPIMHEPVSLTELFRVLPEAAQLVFLHERTEVTSPVDAITLPAFLIGPEGGFSSAEIQKIMLLNNVVPIHLGNTILRAETAAIAVLSCWQFRPFK